MKALVSISMACALALNAGSTLAEPPPIVAAVSSLLVPGLGQALQKDWTTAGTHFGVFAGSLATGLYYEDKDDFIKDGVRYADEDREPINQTTLRRDFALRIATDTMLYSSFAAYRDGRARRDGGYRTP